MTRNGEGSDANGQTQKHDQHLWLQLRRHCSHASDMKAK